MTQYASLVVPRFSLVESRRGGSVIACMDKLRLLKYVVVHLHLWHN